MRHGRLSAAIVPAALACFGAGAALAACPSDEAIDAFVADWKAGTPTRAIAVDATMEDALCAQQKVVARLGEDLGAPVGYKAGLTSKAAQERFGVDQPVRGVLLDGMLLENGATVPAKFGARPVFEADMLVVIADAAVNEASTPQEVLPHIREVIPFIELPDLVLAEGEPMSAPILTAINVGARQGVLGEPIAVEQSDVFLQSLADMEVKVTGDGGEELAAAKGSAVLGHPLNSVIWLVKSGVALAPGDYVSVGSIGPLMPTAAGLTATATYQGLPGEPQVTVSFD
jgi:2-oxo-hept-3-ene-1,7-dioate hydratase